MNGKAAFSLVEVVIALGLFTFAAVGIFALIPISLETSRNAIETNRRAQIIQQVVNTLQEQSFYNLGNTQFVYAYDGSTPNVTNPVYYTVKVAVQTSTTLPTTDGSTVQTSSLIPVTLAISTPATTKLPSCYVYFAGNAGY
jgi:uncharacterized protein (TIGR02598 family)